MEKIYSRRNSKFRHVKNLGKSKNYRNEHGEFICDGKKLLIEAIGSGMEITEVFTIPPLDVNLPRETSVFEVDGDIMDSLSVLKNPQDVLFVCKTPGQPVIDFTRGTHVLLDNVQDPGNVGTIIRSADAFGISSVILCGENADPYNPKAIRASMGAIFRQKFIFADAVQLRNFKARFIGTARNDKLTPAGKANLKDSILVLGNEGQGISGEVAALCSEMITIPIAQGCESLNVAVAASIIMYEAGKTMIDD